MFNTNRYLHNRHLDYYGALHATVQCNMTLAVTVYVVKQILLIRLHDWGLSSFENPFFYCLRQVFSRINRKYLIHCSYSCWWRRNLAKGLNLNDLIDVYLGAKQQLVDHFSFQNLFKNRTHFIAEWQKFKL
jgi:hypothetical protein